jgi:hypothetical protein
MVDSRVACFGCSVVTAVLLIIVLLPFSLSYGTLIIHQFNLRSDITVPRSYTSFRILRVVEYYEYGLDQRKTTGSVNTDKVYPRYDTRNEWGGEADARTMDTHFLPLL